MPDPDSAQTLEISPQDLHDLMQGAGVRLIDCREEDEFALCHIRGATLIPLQQIPENRDALGGEGDRPVVIYCHHGMRSLNATRYLRSIGLAETFSLHGGIDAWSESIDPEVPRY